MVAASFLFCALLFAPQQTPESLLKRGLELADQGNMLQAEQEVRRALQLSPDHTGALTALGKILGWTGRAGDARIYLEKVVELKPTSAQARVNLGIALADAGDMGAALSEFQQAVKLDPNSASAHYNAGRALADLGQQQDAREHLRKAAALDPSLTDALNRLAQLERDAGSLEKAVELLGRAVRANPRNAQTHYSLGLVLADLSRTEQAIEQWEQAVEINPTHRQALYRLSQALRAADPEKARRYNQRFLALRQDRQTADRAGTLGDVALALAKDRRYPEAVSSLKQAIEICGACSAQGLLHKNLGLIYGESGDYPNAERELLTAQKLLPNDRDIPTALDYLRRTTAPRE
ncbi:MAG: tetratricopeptide repeat protein [bacterium]|nr:tetratricopeptide repeat protein [bacterium]